MMILMGDIIILPKVQRIFFLEFYYKNFGEVLTEYVTEKKMDMRAYKS